MTTDRQRAAIEAALRPMFPGSFEVTTDGNEVTVALPIWTEPGRYTIGHYRYASATTRRDFDGRRRLGAFEFADLAASLKMQIRRRSTDPRFTDQAREDYARAAAMIVQHDPLTA